MSPRYFADLALRSHDELTEDAARDAETYALAVFDDLGRAESAAMFADGEIDQIRWYQVEPSPALHARHVTRYGTTGYTVTRDDPAPDGGVLRTLWEVEADGVVWARNVLRFARAGDEPAVESWRYHPDGSAIFHYVYTDGRLVAGEEYGPDGALTRRLP